jgi:hypothetical protein
MTEKDHISDSSIATRIGMTRRQLLGSVSGIAAGAAATGIVQGSGKSEPSGPLYYLH